MNSSPKPIHCRHLALLSSLFHTKEDKDWTRREKEDSRWKVVCQETTTIVTVKDSREAPLIAWQGAKLEELYHKKIARKCWLVVLVMAADRTREIVNLSANFSEGSKKARSQ